ncbi:NAD(P)H-binding protein [Bombilactobacillus mellis]|uniref:NAD(P)H-binding protein n=1 Tax=Bombilactobacillus mellis TaxID=1218508 RepID=UPI0022473062|nr:NAD(P)H-binding protein [Bombilactobacillus mellis]MCX0279241.1 NAD(P)H-binding protein [Bombilactobacillus mellis]
MKTILILGAHGATAQIVTQRLLQETSFQLRLYLRHAQRLATLADNPRIQLIDGDVFDSLTLKSALVDVDIVYSNLGGENLGEMTKQVLTVMQQMGRKRLLFYSALGALHEVPGKFGEWNEQAIASYLPGFREANTLINQYSDINTTQFRPAWLTDKNEIDYEITTETDLFRGTEVSRQSVADFVVKVLQEPTLYPHTSVGLDKPGTQGDRPSWL